MKKKILITGGAGFLSQNLFNYLNNDFNLYLTFNKSKPQIRSDKYVKINLINFSEIDKLIIDLKPDYILNAAGLTNVDSCEYNKKSAFDQNVKIVKNLSKLCKIYKIKLIHISTDHLFSGVKSFYNELDNPRPLNVYSRTKLQAEKYIKQNLKDYTIIRSNFFGWDKKNSNKFFSWIFKNLQNKKKIKLYSDIFFSPVSSFFLSKVIKKIIAKNFKGTINVSSNQRISKYHFGILLAKIFHFDPSLIQKIEYRKLNHKINRPLDMSLSNKKLKNILNMSVPNLSDQVKQLLEHRFDGLFDNIFPIVQYGKHHIDKKDIVNVTNLMKRFPLTQFKEIDKFESNVANYVGSKFAVAVSSCSAGMHLACKVLNLDDKNELVTSPISFVSTANSALHCGSKISFADVDSNTLNITGTTVGKIIKNNSKRKIILPVHFGGNPDNSKSIYKKFQNNRIIEDAAHSFGAKYDNSKMVGSCIYSDMTVFSFHPVKTITTAEGGIITTNNEKYYEKLKILRSHGIVKDKKFFKKKKNASPWYYEVSSLSNHYRITDFQCSLGNSQLEKVEKFIDKRRKLAEIYYDELSKFKNIKIGQRFNKNSSYHLFIIRINFKKINLKRYEIMKILRARGIGSQVHYIPIPMHPLYEKIYNKNIYKDLPNAMKYYDEALSIPIYFDLSYKDQKNIINTLKDILE